MIPSSRFHRSASRTRALCVVALAVLSVAVCSCSASDSSGDKGPAAHPAKTVAPPQLMPNYVGEPYDKVRAQLVGFNARVIERLRVSSQSAGTVIDQMPQAGASFEQTVTLTVSGEPPPVPDVTQSQFGDAQSKLQNLGFTVVEDPLFDDSLADGVVVKQNPPPGSLNTAEVRLTVARRPVETYLSDLVPVDITAVNGFDEGSAKGNGKAYSHALNIGTFATSSAVLEYDLSRQYRRLKGDLTLDDRVASNSQFQIQIFIDSRPVFNSTVILGQTKPIDLDITKALRLRITVTRINTGYSPGTGGVILGDTRAQGLQSEVEATPSPSPSS